MYKNITYYNNEKSIRKYEQKLLSSNLLNNVHKLEYGGKETVYKNSEVIISVNKRIVNFLIFNKDNYELIKEIEALEK